MITTRDGFELKIGEEYTVVSLDMDDQFIESSTRCVYGGHRVQDNTKFLDSIGNNCSGWCPKTVNMHRFTPLSVKCIEDVEILESRVKHIVIQEESAIEAVVVRRLK